MNVGGKSPRNEQEIAEFFAKEQKAQEYMDVFYKNRGHRIVSRNGCREYDLILSLDGRGVNQKIEEKFRFNQPQIRDVLIELIQDVVSGELGWFYHADCDFLHYIWCNEECLPFRMLRINWPSFKEWFLDNYLGSKKVLLVISDKGWGLTFNVAINFKDLSSNLALECSISFDDF